MSIRFGQIATQPFVDRRTGSFRWIVIAACVFALLIVYVGGKVQIVRLGSQIEELEQKKQELERANRALQIEASSLAAPARIEEIGLKRLGMVRPAKENVVVVKRVSGAAQGSGRQ